MGEAMEQLLAAVEAVEGATAANSTLALCAQTFERSPYYQAESDLPHTWSFCSSSGRPNAQASRILKTAEATSSPKPM